MEEVLVCSDGSQPEILQGLDCRRGDFIVSLSYISMWESCFISSLTSLFLQASDLDGEIDLSTCCNVTEYQAQRNYGFQIHVRARSASSHLFLTLQYLFVLEFTSILVQQKSCFLC